MTIRHSQRRRFELDESVLRTLRYLLTRALEVLPDPDATVHAPPLRDDRAAMCGRGGSLPLTTDRPEHVTCLACQKMPEFDVWAEPLGEP